MLGVHKIIGANIAVFHIFSLLLAACFISSFLIDFRIWLAFIGLCALFALFLNPFLFYLLFVSLISTEGIPGLENFSYAKFAGIILVLCLVFRLLIKQERLDLSDNFYIYLLLFFIGAFVSTLGAKDYSNSLRIILTYFTLGGLFFVTRYFLTSIENIDKTLTVLLVSILITYVLARFVGSADEYLLGSWRVTSGEWDVNEFGSFILVLLPLGFYRAMHSFGLSKVFSYVLIFALMILLIFTGSRGAMLGFIGMTSVLVFHYGHRRSKQVFFFIFISAIVLYFIAPEGFWYRAATILNPAREAETQSSSISTRWVLYHAAWQMFLDHPFTGVGIYNFQHNASNYGVPALVVHNTYLELLSGGGLLTFIPFALILIDRFGKLKLNRNCDNKLQDLIICLKASFVSFLITAVFYSADHEKIFWFLLALISSAYYLASNKERETQSSGDHAATATTIGKAD